MRTRNTISTKPISIRWTPRGVRVIKTLVVGFILLIGALFTTTSGHSPSAPAVAAEPVHHGTYEIIVVHPGDTLWGISSRLAQHGDRNRVMEQILDYNDLKTSDLEVGQTLYVPMPTD